MEDQPTDSGDLTTDAAAAPKRRAPGSASDAARQDAAGLQAESAEEQTAPEADEATVDERTSDEPSAAIELTSSVAEEPTAKPRRRRNFLRRKKNQPEVAATEEVVTEQPTDGAPRRRCGTSCRRGARSTKPVAEAADDETDGERTEVRGSVDGRLDPFSFRTDPRASG